MPIMMFPQICWIRMLFLITGLCSVFKLSYEATPLQNASSENSSTNVHNSEVHNLTSHESNWLSMDNTTDSSSSASPGRDDERLFNWDNKPLTAGDLQVSYCSRHCHNNYLVTPPGGDWCFDVKCFPCDCNKPLCQFYGTCCPDYNPSVDSKLVFDDAQNMTHKHWLISNVENRTMRSSNDTTMDLVCDGDGYHKYLSKRSCPSTYPDGDRKSKCQNDIPTAELDIDTFVHVIDNITGRSYYNEYCAICNNVSQFTPWNLTVECESYMTVYSSRTPGELLRLSLASDSGCKTRQAPSDGYLSYKCERVWFSREVVDTCNVTGEWRVYDENVVRACADISGLINRVQIGAYPNDRVYKNVFCAICNMQGYPEFDKDCSIDVGGLLGGDIRLPFSVLLNFGSQRRLTTQRHDAIKCYQDSEWTSPDNEYLPLQCSPGKILTNGSCSTALSQIRGLLYQIHAYYVPSVAIEMTVNTEHASQSQEKYLRSFQNQIKRVVGNIGKTLQISVTGTISHKTFPIWDNQTEGQVNTSHPLKINWFTVDGYILADQSLSRDEVETFIVSELILNNITVDIDTDTTMTLIPVLRPLRKLAHKNSMSTDQDILSRNALLDFRLYITHLRLKHMQDAIIIEPHLNCAFVKFDKADYLNQSDNTSQIPSITLFFKSARMTFSERTELNMVSIGEDRTVRICHELLNTKNLIDDGIINNNLLTTSLYILTLICLIVSIVCLVMTLMTYFLFPVLRSIAGKNNIFLCLSLLLAQLSLLATSHVPEASHICTILAICTHFLWLSMFCWCFICCFHMYCVFSAKTRSIQSTTNSELRYMIRRVVGCSVIPGVTVAGVITADYIISGGQFIGYGNTTCFIDSQIILVSTLVAPLCLILLLNFIFFLITIIKIYNVRKLQSREFRKDDHSNLYIYIKLSSMTGIFWIISVISEATDNDPLRFIAIGLNGLQGVFIFLSYICNRRVLNLYLKLLGLEQYLATSTFSKISTIAKVVADMDKLSHGCEDRETVE